MGLFDRLLRRSRDGSPPDGPRRLRLQYPPTPEYAHHHAEIAVSSAREVDGILLDYSPASLAHVDAIIGRFHAEGLTSAQMAETLFGFGCYLGEVFVAHHGGVWRMPADTNVPKELIGEGNLMLVVLPNGTVCNPIGRAFKRLDVGEGESLGYFYRVFSAERG